MALNVPSSLPNDNESITTDEFSDEINTATSIHSASPAADTDTSIPASPAANESTDVNLPFDVTAEALELYPDESLPTAFTSFAYSPLSSFTITESSSNH